MNKNRTISLFLCLFVITVNAFADDWPFIFGPAHNGISKEKNWLDDTPSAEDMEILWTKDVGAGCTSVVVKSGRAYTMSNTGRKWYPKTHTDVVYCLDCDTGNEIWRFEYECGLNFKSNTPAGPFATPTVDDDRVYTFSRKGDAYCISAKTGESIWHKDLKTQLGMLMPFQGGFAGSPLVLDNKVVYNAGAAGVVLDKMTGALIWASDPNVAAQATPVPFERNGAKLLAIFSGVGLVTVNADCGKELWRYPWPTKYKTNAANPVISDNKVFISSWYGMGCALLDITHDQPRVLFKSKDMQNHYSTSILFRGHLYGFDISKLKCMDFNTGHIKWTLRGAYGKGNLMMADGKLIVLTEKGVLLIAQASPEGFEAFIDRQILDNKCYAPPTLANRRIYARTLKGSLVCIRTRK